LHPWSASAGRLGHTASRPSTRATPTRREHVHRGFSRRENGRISLPSLRRVYKQCRSPRRHKRSSHRDGPHRPRRSEVSPSTTRTTTCGARRTPLSSRRLPRIYHVVTGRRATRLSTAVYCLARYHNDEGARPSDFSTVDHGHPTHAAGLWRELVELGDSVKSPRRQPPSTATRARSRSIDAHQPRRRERWPGERANIVDVGALSGEIARTSTAVYGPRDHAVHDAAPRCITDAGLSTRCGRQRCGFGQQPLDVRRFGDLHAPPCRRRPRLGPPPLATGSYCLGSGTLQGRCCFALHRNTQRRRSHTSPPSTGGHQRCHEHFVRAPSQHVNALRRRPEWPRALNPSQTGQQVTFTATISPSTATGTVTFYDGATSLGTGSLSSGTATLATSTLTVGSHSITAAYGGDTDDAVSTSDPLTQVVQAITTTGLGSSLNLRNSHSR